MENHEADATAKALELTQIALDKPPHDPDTTIIDADADPEEVRTWTA